MPFLKPFQNNFCNNFAQIFASHLTVEYVVVLVGGLDPGELGPAAGGAPVHRVARVLRRDPPGLHYYYIFITRYCMLFIRYFMLFIAYSLYATLCYLLYIIIYIGHVGLEFMGRLWSK